MINIQNNFPVGKISLFIAKRTFYLTIHRQIDKKYKIFF